MMKILNVFIFSGILFVWLVDAFGPLTTTTLQQRWSHDRSNNRFSTSLPKDKAGDATSSSIKEDSPSVDAMRARAGVLRRSILQQQLELQKLEREIVCCDRPKQKTNYRQSLEEDEGGRLAIMVNRTLTTFSASTNVLKRKMERVRGKVGKHNKRWDSVQDFVVSQTQTGARIVNRLFQNPDRLLQLVDPDTPTLVPHVPAILARLDRLENHVNPILERVLNNRRHLASIEPYLDEILERFDDIEPHMPWILDNIDELAPYTGLLLKHIDSLLLYAQDEDADDSYDLAQQLLPFLQFYVSRLDMVGPHLPLLRPHIPLLLKHNRIAKMTPFIDRLFATARYDFLGVSANLDVLLFWLGWTLRVPGLRYVFFAVPGSPRLVVFLANRLPKRFVRGYCSGISCNLDGDYGGSWNRLDKPSTAQEIST